MYMYRHTQMRILDFKEAREMYMYSGYAVNRKAHGSQSLAQHMQNLVVEEHRQHLRVEPLLIAPTSASASRTWLRKRRDPDVLFHVDASATETMIRSFINMKIPATMLNTD